MDKGLLNGVHFLDLKKAFDTVDHEILFRKLIFCGVDSSLKWFQTYLTARKTLKDLTMVLFLITAPLFVVSLKVPSWDPNYSRFI